MIAVRGAEVIQNALAPESGGGLQRSWHQLTFALIVIDQPQNDDIHMEGRWDSRLQINPYHQRQPPTPLEYSFSGTDQKCFIWRR